MTSPYSSALLNEPPARATIPAPSRQLVTPSPAYAGPAYQPQPYAPPMYVQGSPKGGAAANVMMGLVVVLLAAIAAVGGYAMSQQMAPTAEEMVRYQDLAAYGGYQRGRDAGITDGRNYAIEGNAEIVKLKGMIAKQQAWNKGYAQGKKTGLTNTRRRSTGYGYNRGYTPRRYYGGGRSAQVNSALATAQSLANSTGAPVDVEIY